MLKRIHQFLLPKELNEGWTPYLWLVYLVFFFIDWFYQPPGMTQTILGGLTILAFLVLYFSAYRREGLVALLHVLGILALAIAWTTTNMGASVLYIFAASFACRVGRMRTGFIIVGFIMLCAALSGYWFQASWFFWFPAVMFSFIIGATNLIFTQNERKNAELRMSQAEVRRLARIAERERIARDLHDVLGHTLSLITVKSELAGRLIHDKPEQAAEEIDSIQHTARKALTEVREAISGINDMSLSEALEQARLALQSADVSLSIQVDSTIELPPQTEAMLSLVIREAVTNIIRHADARTCSIRLIHDEQADQQYRLEISDDGRGSIRADGNGIQGMRARIESINGRLSIPEDRKGGRLIAQIPAAVL